MILNGNQRREGKVNRCQAPKKKSLKREGAGMREPFHQSLTFPNIETKTKKEEEKGKDKWPKVNQTDMCLSVWRSKKEQINSWQNKGRKFWKTVMMERK